MLYINSLYELLTGITAGNGLNGWGSILIIGKKFSALHSVQTGFKARLASYPVGTWRLFSRR
jgi:hypothetical protein